MIVLRLLDYTQSDSFKLLITSLITSHFLHLTSYKKFVSNSVSKINYNVDLNQYTKFNL